MIVGLASLLPVLRHFFFTFINQASRQPEVGEMDVKVLGEDKKNISPAFMAFPTTRPLFTDDGVSPAGDVRGRRCND